MKILLNSYIPLVYNEYGKEASLKYRIPPYVDGSIRREPDFESPYPSITALCRGPKCAPRLCSDDIIVYITKKNKYFPYLINHWRLTAVLKILEKFDDHMKGAKWYMSKKLPIPNNCLVEGNDPFPETHSVGLIFKIGSRKMKRIMSYDTEKRNTILINFYKNWDKEYFEKTKLDPDFLISKSLFLNIYNPPPLFENDMLNVFNYIPNTRNPPQISSVEFEKLMKIVNRKVK